MSLRNLFKLAKEGAKSVYDTFECKIITTEFSLTTVMVDNNVWIQQLDIGGTRGLLDWIPNTLLFSWKGYKIGDWWSARRIKRSKYFKDRRKSVLPLMITGHSRGGGTAIVFMHAFGNWNVDMCVPFNPPPVLRSWLVEKGRMPHTYIFINTNDMVSKAGEVNFDHPLVTGKYLNTEDAGGIAENHDIDLWDEFISNKEFIDYEWQTSKEN